MKEVDYMAVKRVKTPWYNYYDGVQKHLEYPDFSVYKLIEYTASKHLNNISYNYYGTKKTYHEFLKQIDEAARSFKALGIKHKDIVSICMPNTPEAIIAFYAINKIGAISNLIHPLSGENEIKSFLNKTSSKYIVTIDVALDKIENIIDDTKIKNIIVASAADSMPLYLSTAYKAMNIYNQAMSVINKYVGKNKDKILKWNDFIKLGKSYTKEIEDDFKGKEVAAILYSGGTTGEPKGVELTNLNLNAIAMQAFEACACLNEKDKVLAIMPIFHGFGLAVCIHTVQYFGGTSILVPQFSAKTFDKLLRKYEPNIIVGVPTLYEALLKNKSIIRHNMSYIKCAISGGDSLSIELKKKIDKFFKKHGADVQIREGYGLTECGSVSCLTPQNYYREGSIGVPLPDTLYKIIDPSTEKELPYGEDGEIVISGPTVMRGYYRSKKETKQTLRKHKDGHIWLHTGDRAYMDKDGFIYYKQRIKRMIVSSGYCIYPQYIENVIDGHEDVLMSCVIGIPHPYKVEVAKAFIVLKNSNKASDEVLESIKKHCEKNLAIYSWPYEYEFREELPKTLVGKIAYNVLMQEEEAKAKDRKFSKDDKKPITVEVVPDEVTDKMKKS
ncbi:MAG: AMP-binding protein [Bacilli bacterium]|nr:AMP-binding protein [Bacilli bacterium]